MNKIFIWVIGAIVLLFIFGALVEARWGHISGRTLILCTTTDQERTAIRSELLYIAAHADAVPTASAHIDSDAYSLTSLRKVAIAPFVTDSSQVCDSHDTKVQWDVWIIRQLNLKLLSQPVYTIAARNPNAIKP